MLTELVFFGISLIRSLNIGLSLSYKHVFLEYQLRLSVKILELYLNVNLRVISPHQKYLLNIFETLRFIVFFVIYEFILKHKSLTIFWNTLCKASGDIKVWKENWDVKSEWTTKMLVHNNGEQWDLVDFLYRLALMVSAFAAKPKRQSFIGMPNSLKC